MHQTNITNEFICQHLTIKMDYSYTWFEQSKLLLNTMSVWVQIYWFNSQNKSDPSCS